MTVTARDPFGNLATGYRGTVHFTSSDAAATLPPDYTFKAGDAGVAQLPASIVLRTAGTRSVTATDTSNSSISASSTVVVTPAAASVIVLSGAATATAGIGMTVTVTAYDPSGNVATGYTGTISFSSSDAQASLPGTYSFAAGDAGTHTFPSVVLRTAGSRTLTATDQAGLTNSIPVAITAAAASRLSLSGFPATIANGVPGVFQVRALDSWGNIDLTYAGRVRFSSTDTLANLPLDSTLTGGASTFSATLQTVGTQSITATDTAVATITGSQTGISVTCWQLAAVNRVRFYPRPGNAAAMLGGTIQGSNDSATNGFTILATISSVPPDGTWTELAFPNAVPYRYMKYYGPAGSFGQIAEIEFYAGSERLTGDGFGTAGSRSANPWQNALDGNPATFFDGPVADNVYVGIDAASGHVVASPTFSPPAGAYPSPVAVTISSNTPGAAIRYSSDGSDPSSGGLSYTAPVTIGSGTTTLRGVATKSCMLTSAITVGLYTVGGGAQTQSSLHIGNSLTDSIDPYMQPLAASGGITLDYWRYTVPGTGTYIYRNYSTGGNGGIANIQTEVRTKPYKHISMQPASNMPCVPTGHASETDALNRSDAVNIDDVWNDAVGPNANVQMWVYSTWPAPSDFGPSSSNCITGGWNRDPTIWNPSRSTSWEEGVSLFTQFNEAVRTGLVGSHTARPPPYIVPAGMALVNLKHAVEAGNIPGIAATTSAFWTLVFQGGYGTDDHLTNNGRYFVTLVFYAAMFQRSPAGLQHANTTLTDAQAAAFQNIAWQTVTGYALSGWNRP